MNEINKSEQRAALAVANGTMNLRVNALFFTKLFRESFLIPALRRLPIQFGHEFYRPQVWIRIAVAGDAPGHR